MVVRILRARVLVDAGQERKLNLGDVVDLPIEVATSLIATGAAKRPAYGEHTVEAGD